jgi:glycosyltransferase involved in cell wall biosynthesis
MKNIHHKVEILLATYNGDKHLDSLINSIINQTYKNWILLIRDDCSSDNTTKILKKFKNDYPNKLKIIDNKNIRLGACQNFHELLKFSNAEYLFLCDQDDIWLKNKVEISLKKILLLENVFGKNHPILIHTNLKLMNSSNNILSDSFWNSYSINPEIMYIPEIIFSQNFITGCTILINESTKRISLPIPLEAVMHDWWIALKTVKHGIIKNISTPTVLYRIHESNASGIKKMGIFSSLIPNTLITFSLFHKIRSINKLLGYKINCVKAILYLLYYSFKRYKNTFLKRDHIQFDL